MKILQINCVYAQGSTGKITRDIHHGLLERGHESVVFYGRRKRVKDHNVYKLCPEWYAKINNLRSRLDGMMYTGSYFSTQVIISKIRKEKPDVIHLQCINGYFCNIFRLLTFLKRHHIPTVLTLHAEFMYTANCGYAGDCTQWIDGCQKCPRLRQETLSLYFDKTQSSWSRMHEIYKDWEQLTVVACSSWIQDRAKQCGEIKSRKIITIHNGIDNDRIWFPRAGEKNKICERYGINPQKKVVLFAAPYFSALKGFDYVIQLIEECEALPFHFLLVGENFPIKKENVTVLGNISDQEFLAQIYSAADVFLICSRCENYPTVCLEATSCGTPVAGFDVGGVRETIPQGMGGVVPVGDIEAMKALLIELTKQKPNDQTVEEARKYHCKDRMIEAYIRCYASALER